MNRSMVVQAYRIAIASAAGIWVYLWLTPAKREQK